MKTKQLIYMLVITTGLVNLAIAENGSEMMPPPGPYRSVGDVDQHSQSLKAQDNYMQEQRYGYFDNQSARSNRAVPDWLKLQQMQMENWMRQSNRSQLPNWNNNQHPVAPRYYPEQRPVFQNNVMPQPFPSARGPVYGPGTPPSDFYMQPMRPAPRYRCC